MRDHPHPFELLEPRTLLAAGELDLSFGVAGLASHQVGYSSPHALAIQPDGKLLVAGHTGARENAPTDFLLLRLNPDGALDPTFGKAGVVIHDLGAPNDSIRALVLDPDGKILVGGITTRPDTATDFVLARFTPSGELDPTFGDAGIVTTHFNADDSLESLALQPDGRILAAGTANASSATPQVAIARYLHDGSLDASFDGDGALTIGDMPRATAAAIAFHPTGRIIVAGNTINEGSFDRVGQILLLALTPDGSPDPTFGNAGSVTVNPGSSVSLKDLAIDSKGRILTVSIERTYGYLTRFLPGGTIDTSFANTGHLRDVFGSSTPATARYAIAVQSDDKPILGRAGGGVFLGGGAAPCGPAVGGPKRLTATGTTDLAFGALGLGQAAPRTTRVPTDMLIQSDGAIVSLSADTGGRVVLLRHLRDGDPFFNLDGDGVLTLRGTPGHDDLELRSYSCDVLEPITIRLGSSVHHILADLHPITRIRILADAGDDTITLFGDDTGTTPSNYDDPSLPTYFFVDVLAGEGEDHVLHGITGRAQFSFDGQGGDDRLTLTTKSRPFAVSGEHFMLKATTIEGDRKIAYANFERLASQGTGTFQIVSPPTTLPLSLTGTALGIDVVPPGALAFQAPPGFNAWLDVAAGAYHLPDPALSLGDPRIRVRPGGTVVLTDDLTFASLSLDGGKLITAPGRHTFTLAPQNAGDRYYLDQLAQSTFDLADNTLILRYVPPPPYVNTSLAQVMSDIRRARNSPLGLWQGPGLTSSTAADNPFTTLAAILNPGLATFRGKPLNPNDILITHTWNGDTNLDGRVNADDYFRIDQGFLAQPVNPTYRDGDFNYDGRVNADDYFLIDQAFLGQTTPLPASTSSPPVSSAPSPRTTRPRPDLPTLPTRKTRHIRPKPIYELFA